MCELLIIIIIITIIRFLIYAIGEKIRRILKKPSSFRSYL